ncbi:hypothetical protein [Sporisorium scitamineum]|uniref:Uncharacterized protein n=1 Tax=Sporisorium scitamineum TaxID=49012 RepID=A0A0F7RX23_9BASI|nr:hypothetical protein [Sporisorium scitamineum]
MLLVEHLASVLKQEQLGLPPDMLTLIAHQSQVLVRKALSLLDQAISYARYDVKLHDIAQALGIIDHRAITLLVTAIVQCNADRALKEVQDGEHAGYDLTKLMTQLAWYIHNITLVQVLNEPAGRWPSYAAKAIGSASLLQRPN